MTDQTELSPLDFNDDTAPAASDRSAEREAIRSSLMARLDSVLLTIFPAGKVKRGKFYIGDVLGSPGDSLEVVLTGEKAGLWTDRASGEGGDIFSLIAASQGISTRTDFARLLAFCADLTGRAQAVARPARRTKVQVPVDELGPATARWEYLDAAGALIAVVYRYDPPGGRKQFRPWDAKRRKMAPPTPRPLYNQPGMLHAGEVVLVEGEKCAQALIDAGWSTTGIVTLSQLVAFLAFQIRAVTGLRIASARRISPRLARGNERAVSRRCAGCRYAPYAD